MDVLLASYSRLVVQMLATTTVLAMVTLLWETAAEHSWPPKWESLGGWGLACFIIWWFMRRWDKREEDDRTRGNERYALEVRKTEALISDLKLFQQLEEEERRTHAALMARFETVAGAQERMARSSESLAGAQERMALILERIENTLDKKGG